VCIRQYWTKPNASFIFSVLVLCTQPQVNMMFVMLGRGHTIALVLGDYHRISVLAWTHTKLMLECKPSTSRSHSKKQRLLACCCWQIKIKNVSNNLKSIILKSTNILYSCDFVTKFRTYSIENVSLSKVQAQMLARSLFMIILYVLHRDVNIVYYIITRGQELN
jgi:hypothetical protein